MGSADSSGSLAFVGFEVSIELAAPALASGRGGVGLSLGRGGVNFI